jgi:predicted permease
MMRLFAPLRSRLTYLWTRGRVDADLVREIAFHLEARADDLEREGLDRAEALEVARREFGSDLRARERSHDAWQFRWLEDIAADTRYAVRTLARTPAFTLTVLTTLAIGIGANTAIFDIVNGVLLRPLPYRAPHELLILGERTKEIEQGSVSYPNFVDWQAQNRSFSGMALFRGFGFGLSTASGPVRISGRTVSAGFFRVLGVSPFLGRTFSPADDRPGAEPVAIISHRFWETRFGLDPGIVGRPLVLSGRPTAVIGVLPAGFRFYSDADAYVPFASTNDMMIADREMRSGAYAVARLAPGVTRAAAEADLGVLAQRLAAAYPKSNGGYGISATPILDDMVGGSRRMLYLLLAAVAVVLVISCVNVANLLFARAATRGREVAIRAAIGAGRGRIFRQLLTESLLLSLAGATLGLGIAAWGSRLLLESMPDALPRADQVRFDFNVFLFTVVVGVGAGLVSGVVPCRRAIRADLQSTLTRRTAAAGTRHRPQDVLVTAELGLAVLLLVCAGLTLRSAAELRRADPGFDRGDVITFNVMLSKGRYDTGARIRRFYQDLLERLAAEPGVQSAALTTNVPIREDSELFFHVDGRPRPAKEDMPWAMLYPVTPDYLHAMGVSLVRGRFFTSRDAENAAEVVVIDEVLARSVFPSQDPIGQRVIFPLPGLDQPREIVGIVRHVQHWGVQQDAHAKIRNQLYMPLWQVPDALWPLAGLGTTALVRPAVAAGALGPALEKAVRGIDPDQPVWGMGTMGEIVATSLAAHRFAALLLAIFAGVALALAAIGIYGVITYGVTQRTHEFGVRMALGATRGDVLWMVVRGGARRAALGIAVGLAAALGATRLLSALLFNVSPTEPFVFAGVSALLLAVAAAASYAPARRALRVNPTQALRAE